MTTNTTKEQAGAVDSVSDEWLAGELAKTDFAATHLLYVSPWRRQTYIALRELQRLRSSHTERGDVADAADIAAIREAVNDGCVCDSCQQKRILLRELDQLRDEKSALIERGLELQREVNALRTPPPEGARCGYHSYRHHTCALPFGHEGEHNSRADRSGSFWGTDPEDEPLKPPTPSASADDARDAARWRELKAAAEDGDSGLVSMLMEKSSDEWDATVDTALSSGRGK